MVTIYPADDKAIRELAAMLQAGKLVAFPTETVYGLGADARCANAVRAVYQLKNRPDFNPLISHYAELSRLQRDVVWSPLAELVAEHFWPGPLTMVLQKTASSTLCDAATAGLQSAAVRMPSHPLAVQLLREFAGPVVAPSANPSGYLSPVTANHVVQAFDGESLAVLDGGRTPRGLESTIVRLHDDEIFLLREGVISQEQLEKALNQPVQIASAHGTQPQSPGQLLKHYAPRTPLRLDCQHPKPHEALIGFGSDMEMHYPGFHHYENLSPAGDLEEAAANLFHLLHRLDHRSDIRAIAVAPIPQKGVGRAIHDRLTRAAYQN
jgi:L-threonylcarbamoyladenylate synthase